MGVGAGRRGVGVVRGDVGGLFAWRHVTDGGWRLVDLVGRVGYLRIERLGNRRGIHLGTGRLGDRRDVLRRTDRFGGRWHIHGRIDWFGSEKRLLFDGTQIGTLWLNDWAFGHFLLDRAQTRQLKCHLQSTNTVPTLPFTVSRG